MNLPFLSTSIIVRLLERVFGRGGQGSADPCPLSQTHSPNPLIFYKIITQPMSCTPSHYRFCPCCGGLLVEAIRSAHPRLVCRECRQVLYVNPAVGVAVVVRRGEDLLWGRRRSGLYPGHWCIPCGYVEWGEEVRAAAGASFRRKPASS